MIIGRYYADGSPVEEVNLRDKGRMFELEVCVIKHPRRYPEYNVDYGSLAFCETKESAEEMMNIYERVLGVRFDRSEYMACWLYNEAGQEIDKRLFPSYYSEDGFEGRSADEVRFKFGDIAELYDGDTVQKKMGRHIVVISLMTPILSLRIILTTLAVICMLMHFLYSSLTS